MAKKGTKQIKYHHSYPRIAEVACAEGGFTDAKLAKLFDVYIGTISFWKKEHPEFLEAVKRGKDKFDTENVENSLLKRALGYQYKEIVKEVDPSTKELCTTKITRKDVAADVKAQTFWLRNRNRERWPDTKNTKGEFDVKMTHEEMLDELE